MYIYFKWPGCVKRKIERNSLCSSCCFHITVDELCHLFSGWTAQPQARNIWQITHFVPNISSYIFKSLGKIFNWQKICPDLTWNCLFCRWFHIIPLSHMWHQCTSKKNKGGCRLAVIRYLYPQSGAITLYLLSSQQQFFKALIMLITSSHYPLPSPPLQDPDFQILMAVYDENILKNPFYLAFEKQRPDLCSRVAELHGIVSHTCCLLLIWFIFFSYIFSLLCGHIQSTKRWIKNMHECSYLILAVPL